jgi:hypothetical protein
MLLRNIHMLAFSLTKVPLGGTKRKQQILRQLQVFNMQIESIPY